MPVGRSRMRQHADRQQTFLERWLLDLESLFAGCRKGFFFGSSVLFGKLIQHLSDRNAHIFELHDDTFIAELLAAIQK